MRHLNVGMALAVALFVACSSDEQGDGGPGDGVDFGNAGPNSGNGSSVLGDDGTAGGGVLGGTPGAPIGADGLPTSCAHGNVHTSRVTPTVILVLDGSCSMSTDYPSSGQSATSCVNNGGSRWSALRSALLDPTTGVVTTLQGVVRFGLVVFGTAGQCPIPGQVIDPALDNGRPIDANFPNVPPGMFTPTGAALDWVYDNLATAQEVLDNDLGPQIVILATDGEPNSCNDAQTNYQPSVDALLKGQSRGVTTYVISLAAAAGEFHDHLQQLADIGANPSGGAGGPGTLYQPTTPEELAGDLAGLVGGAVGCDVALNGRIEMGTECAGRVDLNGTPLGCNDPNGWILLDPRHIRLQGAACDMLTQSPDALLNADFPCESFTPD